MSEKREKIINIRVSESEKEKIDELAKSVSIDVSALMRNAVLTEEKIILLQGGTEIASGLGTLVSEVQKFHKCDKIDSTYAPVILSRIETLITLFNNLTEKLTDLSEDEEA